MKIDTQPTVLITGPTAGIGYQLAVLFAQNKYQIVLVGRGKQKLVEVKQELEENFQAQVSVIEINLAKPEAADYIGKEVKKRGLTIDVLINNAGFGHRSLFATMDAKILSQMMQVNMLTLTQLTRIFLPGMIARKQGRIMFLASVAGFVPGPVMAIYYASKSFVLSLGRALAYEVAGTGVTVTTVCPGPTVTNFANRASMQNSHLYSHYPGMSADEVARLAYKALMNGTEVEITGWANKLSVFGLRFLPMKWAVRLGRNPQKQNQT